MTCTRAQTINTHVFPLGYTHTYINLHYVISVLFNNIYKLMQAALYNRLASEQRTVPLVRLSLYHSLFGVTWWSTLLNVTNYNWGEPDHERALHLRKARRFCLHISCSCAKLQFIYIQTLPMHAFYCVFLWEEAV